MKGAIFLIKRIRESKDSVFKATSQKYKITYKGRLISETSVYFCRNFKSEGLQ